MPPPALAIVIPPVFQRIRRGARQGPPHGGRQLSPVLRMDGRCIRQTLQIAGDRAGHSGAAGGVALDPGQILGRVIVHDQHPGAVQQQVAQLRAELLLGERLCFLCGIGAKDTDQIAAVRLRPPQGLHRQPAQAAALWPDLDQPPQGRSLGPAWAACSKRGPLPAAGTRHKGSADSRRSSSGSE